MNVLIATSPEHVKYFLVTLESLYQNNKDENIDVYVMHESTANIEWKPLLHQAEQYHAHIYPLQVNSELFKDFPVVSANWPRFLYFKLMVASLIPDTLDRVITLESDMIITKSLLPYYNIDFEDKLIAACEAPLFEDVRMFDMKRLQRYLALDDKTLIFGGGTMVMNLKKMRENPITFEDICKLADQYHYIWCAPEETLLPALYGRSVKIMDSYSYYLMPHIWNKDEKAILDKNDSYGTILHYAGYTDKPWDHFVFEDESFWDKLWWEYAEKTYYYEEMKNRLVQRQQNRTQEKFQKHTLVNLYHNYQLMIRWKFTESLLGKSPFENYMIKYNFKKIAIYGLNPFQILLYNELKNSNMVSEIYLLDTYMQYEKSAYPVILASEFDFKKVDAVIVSAFYHYDEIKNSLSGKACDIVPIDKIIDELTPEEFDLYEIAFAL